MKHAIFFVFVCFVFLFSSCEKEIMVDLRTAPPKLVIEGIVQENQPARVRLTTTKGFYEDNEFPTLTNATVVISDDEGNEEALRLDDSGWYVARKLIGKIGETYNLTVEYEDKIYTASSKMPPCVKIDSVSSIKVPIYDIPFPVLHFTDPPGEENHYYRNLIYVNGKRVKKDNETTSAEFVDGYPIQRIIPIMMGQLDDEEDELQRGDEITIELYSIDKATFLFFETLGQVDNSLNNPTTNITGGALGYFGAYPMDKTSMIIDW